MLTPKTPRVDTHKASILYRLLLGHQIKNKEMWNHILQHSKNDKK